MILIDGYTIIEEKNGIFRNKKFLAKRNNDGLKVIIKLMEDPDQYQIRKMKDEFEILKILNINGVIKCHDLIHEKNSIFIVTEYFEGESLDILYQNKSMPLLDFLSLSIKIIGVLDNIHRNNVIHKDIKPHHILINNQNDIRIIDFGIASRVSREIITSSNQNLLEGTLDYISPEQTGRMNRTIDYRTDYYSLGIMFYQLLTGKLPFSSDDPMEIIHNHIAIIPEEPSSFDDRIPLVVSKIVMKLISKNAESRYQSASGIMYDLEKCRNELSKSGLIVDFDLGMKDIPGRLRIPEKLYGRNKEIGMLKTNLESSSRGEKKIVFMTGSAGIGKSALINDLQKNIIEKKGYFISGKYDQFKRNIPFSALVDSFRELIKQIISEPDEKISLWKTDILDAIGNNGNVIIDVIPELELIIGSQPDMPVLPAIETQNRFNNVFEKYVKVFSKESQPLILFLDDLQWLDNGSIKLLDILFSDDDLKYFMFIGAYRENEISPEHRLNILIDQLNKSGKKDFIFNLGPLDTGNISELLSETFHCDGEKTFDLAKVIFEKCGGNPFFINQFIGSIFEEKLIRFDEEWHWDIAGIRQMRVTDNVIDLMTEKINRFEKNAAEVIKVASCIGMSFSLEAISRILEKETDGIFSLLNDVINEGILVKKDDNFRFVHDKIRESAYLMMDEKTKVMVHYKHSKILLEKYQSDEDLLFDIVNNLMPSIKLLDDGEMKLFANLSLKASQKAKLSTAYDISLNFIKCCMDTLTKNSWETDYSLSLAIYTERAELEYLNNNFDIADDYFEIVLKRTKNELDNLKIYEMKILSLASRLKLKEAISYGIEVLRKYGIKLTKNPGQFSALPDILKANIILGNRDPMTLLDLPEMKDPYIIASVRILMTISPLTYLVYAEYAPIVTMKLVNLSLKYGNCNSSAFGYAIYGFIKCGLFKEMTFGYKLALLAIKLIDKYSDRFLKGEVLYVIGAFIKHWSHHIKYDESVLFEGFNCSVDTGNKNYAGYNLDDYFSSKFISGNNLEALEDEFARYLNAMYKTNDNSSILYFEVYRQAVFNLRNETKNNTMLNGEAYDENENLPKLLNANNSICLTAYDHVKILLCYLFDDYESGFDIYIGGKKRIKSAYAKFQQPEFYFYYILIFYSIFYRLDKRIRKKNSGNIKKIMKNFEIWSKYCPENHIHKLCLIKAEIARVEGKNDDAIKYYNESIRHAKDNGFMNIAAIANECAARFFLSKKYDQASMYYLLEARYYYAKWGAVAKVKHIEEKYKHLFSINQERYNQFNDMISSIRNIKKNKSDTWSGDSSILDINSVIKSTMSLSGEIDMKNLLKQLINILILNAGAQKCSLVLVNDDRYFIEAQGNAEISVENILISIPLEESKNLCPAIVRYVIKTHEIIMLNDALNEGLFTKDDYIKSNKVRSVLSIPVIKQGIVIGAVYLENNLATGVFSENRIELVKIISLQAAISIENARFIIGMREKERLKKEMEIAERIQTALIPVPPQDDELEIVSYIKPAEEVGGDYYDILRGKDGKLWFAIGDVSGHGVTPGLIMMMAQTSFNNQIDGGKNLLPKDIIYSINNILYDNVRLKLKESHYMTMTVLKYEGNGRFIFSGLHLDMIIYRNKSRTIEIVKTEGVFMSVIRDIKDKLKNNELNLDINDIIVLYTDGIIESRNKSKGNELWGMNNLFRTIEENADKKTEFLKNAIIDNVMEWCGNILYDDITLLIIKRKI